MKRSRQDSDQGKSTPHFSRPTTLIVDAQQAMDIDCNEQIEIIDLCTPKLELSDLTAVLPEFMPRKARASAIDVIERCSQSDPRLAILPLYPMSDLEEQHYPLLANIPSSQLTFTELRRRCTGAFKAGLDITDSDPAIPSFMREKYRLFFGDLLERLNVDLSILDYNYTRLNRYLKMLIDEQGQVFNLRPCEMQYIDDDEYPLALEFYLQFDRMLVDHLSCRLCRCFLVHMFYMKTCSFRFARPRSLQEGLFCLQEPEARYELAACGNCALCYPHYDMTYRTKKCLVDFNQAYQHTFVSGYRAMLNCSASCHTQNIVYALTCPCGNVDYVGATKYSLPNRLKKHREHGNRIMHEFLLGQENSTRDLVQGKTNETLRKDRMRLYQHSVRCPVAMQLFLDANPQYWRFVPMSLEESQRPEQQQIQPGSLSNDTDAQLRSQENCSVCLRSVPKSPTGFTFSNRQIFLQAQYFQKKRDHHLPNQDLDLYHASIVAVLPETCSDMFRKTIESLFVTYAQTSLNTVGNVLSDEQRNLYYPLNNPWLLRGDEWCQGLVRRPQPKPPTTTK